MVHKAERGLFELRQGRAVHVTGPRSGDGSAAGVLVASVDGLSLERLAQLREAGSPLRLIVTHHRGRAMGLVATAGGVAGPLSFGLDPDCTPADLLALATARPSPENGHFADLSDVRPALPAEAAALELARLGELLPAAVSVPADPAAHPRLAEWLRDGTVLDAPAEQIAAMIGARAIEITHVLEAQVPLEQTEEARFVFFREGNGFVEHVAILIGERDEWPDPVPVRLHSQCLTGDIFGSLRCDCGAQLQGALRHFANEGGGVLVYLAQEGRGIGLGNKIRAYALQQEGLDTMDADHTLGFGADERRYDAAVAILAHLGIERVRLLTNNPEKVRAIEEAGILVVDRTPLHGQLNPHNRRYVEAKVARAGHWLHAMIAEGTGKAGA